MNKNNQKVPSTINSILINNQKWFGFLLVLVFLLSMFIYFILESNNLKEYIFSSILFASFIYGIHLVFIQEKRLGSSKIQLINVDIIFAILGAFLTYLLTQFLPISSIIASATVGIIGYLTFKKNSFAIYCGSFVGMTSAGIFNYYELLLASFICGVIFVIVKPILNGYGGRLGTIAFISTVIVALLFNKS
ncbi:MAG: hypothetical protein K0B10_14860, partial [Vicingaceae bacterium]|nr:hypothetical protein [Vicingaceae bacterium]